MNHRIQSVYIWVRWASSPRRVGPSTGSSSPGTALRTVYRQRFLVTFGKTVALFFPVALTETVVVLGAVLLANQVSPNQ
jgi:hypothetical protein